MKKQLSVFALHTRAAIGRLALVLLGMLICSRKVTNALEWVKTLSGKGEEVGKLVEKGKGQFVGPELAGKKLGVVGLGALLLLAGLKSLPLKPAD